MIKPPSTAARSHRPSQPNTYRDRRGRWGYPRAMWILLLTALSNAGTVVVDAEIPIEVSLDSRPVAQVFTASSIHFPAEAGSHKVTILVNGRPTHLQVDVPKTGRAHVVVGRTGITTDASDAPDAAETAKVDVRLVGNEHLRLTLDGSRHVLGPGDNHAVELTTGDHAFELRSGDGLAIYAIGDLHINGTGPVVVQISAGRAPEVVGDTASWRPSGG